MGLTDVVECGVVAAIPERGDGGVVEEVPLLRLWRVGAYVAGDLVPVLRGEFR